ncbi:NB-ARC domain-containing protein [Roseofilum sp. BLCC_M91]|uniref:NB-ARC domain-containing protein n=1 Tax=Roseofilum halophilum BLCC-M91 TaxID=3022259 RepID=A0ABT7BN46_9CYAN|nr:NB-ARC domain-containing protein [Roseofilum halophilum]MDJ1179974.1 NB-ARC domain-containing protein [Roseofilum halophilum BLCC-M91]
MILKEMLHLADEMIFTKTGKHLDDLQQAIVQGTLERKTYKQIAKEFDCSESRVREVGSELWKILSKELGEEISKSNFRAAMQRSKNSNVFAQNVFKNVSSSFNICEKTRPTVDLSEKYNAQLFDSHDLSEMPELGAFYDRASELETLKTWILEDHCRIITLMGISGIGKTQLAVQLVEQIKSEFETVVWRSLEHAPTLSELEADLIEVFCSPQAEDASAEKKKELPLIKYLQKHRCLIVFDDIQNLCCPEELAGKYKPGYEPYKSFFRKIKNLPHQSCLLLIGWEHPRDCIPLNQQSSGVRMLQLKGLDPVSSETLLRESKLEDVEKWHILNQYEGNPFWLKSVVSLIQELEIEPTDISAEPRLLLPENVKDNLQEQFNRLSPIEQQVLHLLAQAEEPVKLGQLLQNQVLSSSDLINALHSLCDRSLIERKDKRYSLSPVIQQAVHIHDSQEKGST